MPVEKEDTKVLRAYWLQCRPPVALTVRQGLAAFGRAGGVYMPPHKLRELQAQLKVPGSGTQSRGCCVGTDCWAVARAGQGLGGVAAHAVGGAAQVDQRSREQGALAARARPSVSPLATNCVRAQVNTVNIKNIIPELFHENLVRAAQRRAQTAH